MTNDTQPRWAVMDGVLTEAQAPEQSRWAVMDGILTEAQDPAQDAQITPATQTAQEAVAVAWQQRHQGSWITIGEEWTAQDCSDWPHNEFRPLCDAVDAIMAVVRKLQAAGVEVED